MIDCRALPGNEGVLPPDYAGLALRADARVPSGAVVEEGPGGGLRFRRPGALRRLLREAGVEPARPKVAWCYFGPGAAAVAAAVEVAGWGGVRVDAASLVGRAVAGGLVRPPRPSQAGPGADGAARSW
jgi:3-mercaptopyruvate sulfurtransferase SseA